jgi:hypothetical protein
VGGLESHLAPDPDMFILDGMFFAEMLVFGSDAAHWGG